MTNLLLLIALVIVTLFPPGGRVTAQQACTQIMYVFREESGYQNIYLIDPDGTNRKQITNVEGSDEIPVWSPDGKKIAFVRNTELQTRREHLHVMNADGSSVLQLKHGGSRESSPAWSPDGKKIAFISLRSGISAVAPELLVINADGSEQTVIISQESATAKALRLGAYVTFTPDGKHIGFETSERMSNGETRSGISVVNLENKTTTTLRIDAYQPRWSPDGKRIAFRWGTSGASNIFVMDADGKNVRQVTTTDQDLYPAWSPDGQWIAFTSNRNGKSDFLTHDVYIMHPDGSNVRRLTSDMQDYWSPAWSPDGKQLAFWSNLTNKIHVVNSDGTGLRAIAGGSDFVTAQSLSWSPWLCS